MCEDTCRTFKLAKAGGIERTLTCVMCLLRALPKIEVATPPLVSPGNLSLPLVEQRRDFKKPDRNYFSAPKTQIFQLVHQIYFRFMC